MTNIEKSQLIKELAISIGFDACGMAKAAPLLNDAKHFETWLSAGYQAGMKYMENFSDKRIDPTLLVEGAKSIIVVLLNYYPKQYIFENRKYKISRYALGHDYHTVIKNKLSDLLKLINNNVCTTTGRAFIDSAPVMERAWAREAGLGWIGKNSLLLNKKLGSYFFIGELIVDIELEYDSPINDHCGTCRKCLDECPTRAIVLPKVVDSNKCISYNTIENKESEIPETIRHTMNGRIFGCDICQEVCPWNTKLTPHNINEFNTFEVFEKFSDHDLENISEHEFNTIFKDSPVKRSKFAGFKRNMNSIRNI
jgi:epoxyqueuosine reductase